MSEKSRIVVVLLIGARLILLSDMEGVSMTASSSQVLLSQMVFISSGLGFLKGVMFLIGFREMNTG